ncbi:MAG: hypothetical protein M3217_07890, partial [Actinomycetota bacterium]|nr:hypothetical protein [Actinomycetota bacterium]
INVIPAAIAAGAPVEGLPAGYEAVRVDPGAFLGSDFADAVTIEEDEAIDAIGAAVVWDDSGTIVGTVVASRGTDELNRQARGIERDARELRVGAAAAGVEGGGVDALIVGYDAAAVERLAAAWEEALGS